MISCVPEKAGKRMMQRHRMALLAALLPVLVAPGAIRPVAAVVKQDVADFFIVDCLLPGQVRRMGTAARFVTPRRPLRTSAAKCRIRGGEYVAYDRANYETALKVWMAQAKAGDAQAQTNVGEIYEKGLGTDPDYPKAARWYEKAVAQGDSRARINLGRLYEQGLGVKRDLPRALNLYRNASGLKDDELVFASSVTVSAQTEEEIRRLRAELARREKQIQVLQSRLRGAENELQQRRKDIKKDQKELRSLREQVQSKMDSGLTAEQRRKLSELTLSLNEREQQIIAQRVEIEALRRKTGDATGAIEVQMVAIKAREKELRAQLAARRVEAELLSNRLARADQNLQQQQRSVAAAGIKKPSRNEALVAQLDRARNDQKRLRGLLTQTRTRSDGLQERLDLSRAQLTQAVASLETTQRQLRSQRVAFATERSKWQGTLPEEQRAAVNVLEERLALRERRVDEQGQRIADLETVITRQHGQIAALSGEIPAVAQLGPSIDLIDPPLVLTRGEPAASTLPGTDYRDLLGRVAAPAGLIALTVDEETLPVNAAGLFKTRIKTEGATTSVRIAAVDAKGKKADLTFTLVNAVSAQRVSNAVDSGALPIPKGAGFGRYHALVIGNDRYQYLSNLDTAVADAESVAEVLKDQYGFTVALLKNSTRYEVLSALNHLRETLTDKDNLLIYYAGHGTYDERNGRGHWQPVDAKAADSSNWISTLAITDILNTMAARHVLVVADSCYSGAMPRSALATVDSTLSAQKKVKWASALAGSHSRTVLTSGGLQPVLDAGSDGHSVFTAAFLQVLKQSQGAFEGQTLYRRLVSQVAGKAAELSFTQTPEYGPIRFAGHKNGDFVFVAKG